MIREPGSAPAVALDSQASPIRSLDNQLARRQQSVERRGDVVARQAIGALQIPDEFNDHLAAQKAPVPLGQPCEQRNGLSQPSGIVPGEEAQDDICVERNPASRAASAIAASISSIETGR